MMQDLLADRFKFVAIRPRYKRWGESRAVPPDLSCGLWAIY